MTLFNLFNTKTSEKITKEHRRVIKEITQSFNDFYEEEQRKKLESKVEYHKPKKIPRSKNKCVSFESFSGDNYIGVIIDVLHYTKDNKTNILYVVTVLKKNNKKVNPFLKWINETYCNDMTIDVSDIDKKYFNYDWMIKYGTKET